MKKFFKEMIPVVVLAFTVSFMFFIYEPITIFAANTEDFWFGFKDMLNANMIYVTATVIAITVIGIIVLVINRFTKKKRLLDIFILILSTCFIVAYIQGNYLAGSLPSLDGTVIEWNQYNGQGIISCILVLVVLVVNIIVFIKCKAKYKKIIMFVTLAVFIMLCASLVSTLLTNQQMYEPKGEFEVTNKNMNILSTNKNFLILLLDLEDSRTFDKVLKANNKEYIFQDFTYFPDTISAYPYTRESIPFILSGVWYEAETPFTEYLNKTLNESEFIATLKKEKYDVNIYEQDLAWTDNKALEIDNIEAINSDLDEVEFLKQEIKYIMFKYLPFPLKKYSKIETIDYRNAKREKDNTNIIFDCDNKIIYDTLDDITLQKKNYFQFIHADGGHFPWNMNVNFEIIENGTYEDKIEASIRVTEKYLDRIKASGQYDNSIIIVMADHGNNGSERVGKQNPILYIKGINETHDEMQVSDKKVSYVDLNESIYYDLLDGKKSTELLEDIDENRIRRFIWYRDYDDMYEQTLDGHAWETEKLINTGNRYKR